TNIGGGFRGCLPAPARSRSGGRSCGRWRARPHRAGGAGPPPYGGRRAGRGGRAFFGPGGGGPATCWPGSGAQLPTPAPFVAAARGVPSRCGSCSYVESCGGGCAGRRRLLHALDEPDPYCPVVRGGARKLKVQMARSRELPKLESACTTIVTAR